MTSLKERKSFICEIYRAIKLKDDLFKITDELNVFSYVWLQGVVQKISKNEDFLILDDNTGLIRIENCSRMPNIWENLKEGVYIMVIAQPTDDFRTNINRIISLNTTKIQIINDNSNVEMCWPLEVIESNFIDKQ